MATLHPPAVPTRGFAFPRVRVRRAALIVATAALLVMIAALQVNQFGAITRSSYEINELTRIRDERQAENRDLEAKVAGLSSLARVDWEARTRLKMEPARKTLYIEVNRAVPDRQTLPTRFLPPPAPLPPEAEAPWWQRLGRLSPFF